MTRQSEGFISRHLRFVSRRHALDMAAGVCEARGWELEDPGLCWGVGVWQVLVSGGRRPSPIVTVDKRTGEVKRVHQAPR